MSTINGSDLILINRGGTSYKTTIDNYSSVQDTDLIIVNRGGTSYKVTKALDYTISATDLLFLNRGGTSYKVTGADFNSKVAITAPITAVNTSTSVLTFASNKYLGYFLGNQAVKQDAPVTPVTSAITNVSSTPGAFGAWVWDETTLGEPGSLTDIRTRGTAASISGGKPYCDITKGQSIVYIYDNSWPVVGNPAFTANGDLDFSIVKFGDENGTTLGPTTPGSYTTGQWVNQIWVDNDPSQNANNQVSINAAYIWVKPTNSSQLRGNFGAMGNLGSATAITFQDDTQLANFLPGDIITKPNSNGYLSSVTCSTGGENAFATNTSPAIKGSTTAPASLLSSSDFYTNPVTSSVSATSNWGCAWHAASGSYGGPAPFVFNFEGVDTNLTYQLKINSYDTTITLQVTIDGDAVWASTGSTGTNNTPTPVLVRGSAESTLIPIKFTKTSGSFSVLPTENASAPYIYLRGIVGLDPRVELLTNSFYATPSTDMFYVGGDTGNWSNGDTVVGPLIDGTGIVVSTNTSTNTMALQAPIERFAIGSKVIPA